MTLKEFLATANEDHAIALTEAQAYTVQVPKLYTANVMTLLLVGAGVYGLLSDTAQDTNSPVRDICMALMDRLRSEGEFNLAPSESMGQANIQMLDALIAGLPSHSAQFTALKTQLVAGGETTNHPFGGAKIYDVLITRDDCPTVPVTPSPDGFVVVTASADSERHSPLIMGTNSRTGKKQRAGVITAVEKAGVYECRIPNEFRSWPLTLDNPHGVF